MDQTQGTQKVWHLVEFNERLEKFGVIHHLLCGIPEVIDLALSVGRGYLRWRHFLHDADRLHSQLDAGGRTLHLFDLRDIILLEDRERLHRRVKRGQCLREPSLAICLDCHRLFGLCRGGRLVASDDLARGGRLLGIDFNLHHQLVRLLACDDQLRLQLL